MLQNDPATAPPGRARDGGPARRRLAALLSHPIQYLVPLMRRLAARPEIDLTVYFMTDTGLKPGHIKGYGDTMQWDTPLLGGYRHEFLENLSKTKDARNPFSKLNVGVARVLREGRFDALFMHGYATATEWIAWTAAQVLRIPTLFYGDVLLDSPPSFTRSELVRAVARRAFLRGVDGALAMSSQARRFYAHYGVPPERVFWAPLCVDNATWMARSDELRPGSADLKRALGLDPALPVVLFVAHMRNNKRPVDVVDALHRMKVDASLLMVGGGPMFDAVTSRCAELGLSVVSGDGAAAKPGPGRRVHLAGMQNQSKLPGFYAASDVFVLPSGPGEVTPLVVHESMCSSLPVVLSDAVPSRIDFVREGENGFTFPVGDASALANRLDRVLADPVTRAAMGARSRAMISGWNYEVTVSAIVDALHAIGPRSAR